MSRREADAETLAEGVLAGEKRAVARAISLVEDRDPVASDLVRRSQQCRELSSDIEFGHNGTNVDEGVAGGLDLDRRHRGIAARRRCLCGPP